MNIQFFINAIKAIGFSLIFILIGFGCNQEKIRPHEFPRIETTEVLDIDLVGVTFHSRILLTGAQEILEYGFTWDYHKEPDIINNDYVSSTENLKDKEYSIRVTDCFKLGGRYYVRSFVKTKDYLVYGNEISFSISESLAPKILGFTPKNGNIGDTITIFGENLNPLLGIIPKVSIGGVDARIAVALQDSLKIIVPDTIKGLYSKVAISVKGNLAIAQDLFKINPPEIISFFPIEVTNDTIITINGKNFGFGPAKVFFGNFVGDVTSVSKDRILVLPLSARRIQEFAVTVSIFDQQVTSNQKIVFNPTIY